MEITISCSPQFTKQLSLLEKAGGKAALAAKQAERIAARLTAPAATSLFLRSKQTKSGEKRLKNIEKYDLGSGYRLICRKEGSKLLLEFIGTHDKSDNWLSRNRLTQAAATENRYDLQLQTEHDDLSEFRADSAEISSEEDDIYETQLMRKIDEKTLRRIFCSFYDQPQDKIS